MAVAIEMPVFVTVDRKRGATHKYRVESLFAPQHHGHGPTFQRALRSCAKATAQAFRGHVPARDSIAQLGWLALNPTFTVEQLEIDLPAATGGNLPVQVTVARFSIHDQPWACVPRFGGHVVALPVEARHPERVEFLARDLAREVRERRRAAHPERLDPGQFATQKGDFVTTITVHLDVRQGRFEFDPWFAGDARAGVAIEGTFVGSEELPRVAVELSDLYPELLSRTLDPDPRADELHQAIYTERRAAIVLLGPPGAGRTTLLHEAVAQRMEEHDRRPGDLQRVPRVWHLDPSRIIAGMSIVGAWQRRSQAILRHLRDRLDRAYSSPLADVLFVDNPVALCRVGRHAGGVLTLSTLMRPFLERREITVILEASPTEWERLEELDRPFADLFRVIRVPEPPRRDALRQLIARRETVERTTGCTVTRSALRRLVELDERYPGARAAPGSLVDRLAQLADQHPRAVLEEHHVDAAFLGRSGMRPELVDPERALTEDELRTSLEAKLVGQPEAVDALSDVIHLVRSGLVTPGRPASSLLLVGPTGVGKTETAKVLARYLYASEGALVRFDMNEYVDAGAARRLIGDGLSTDGQLTGRIRFQPFSVLLLDEIEKAHPSVHDLLLQLLDEGRLTDAFGHAVDFAQCIVIMTSNVGARDVARRIGLAASAEEQAATYRGALGRAFRPEFLNRIDRVVVFGRLDESSVQHIARLQIARLLRREGLLRRTLVVRLAPEVLPYVATLGFDPELGARALKRALEQRLVGPIANAVVEVPLTQPTALTVTLRDGAIAVDVAPLARRAPAEAEHPLTRLVRLPRRDAADELHRHARSALDVLDQRPSAVIAVASPDATAVPVEMGLSGQLRALLTALEDDDDDDDYEVDSRALRGAQRPFNKRKRLHSRRSHWDIEPSLQERVLQEAARDAVKELMSRPPRTVDDLEIEGFTLPQAFFLTRQPHRLGASSDASLRLRNLTAVAEDAWTLFDPLFVAWRAAIDELGLSVELGPIDGTDRELRVSGPAAEALLQGEEGIHLFYPPERAPVALQVQVAGGDAPGFAFVARPPETVRSYVMPDPTGHPGAVSDLRTQTAVPFGEIAAWMATWLVQGLSIED